MVVLSRELAANFGNFHVVHHRKVDGFLISGRNCGTHWLKYMLSHGLAAEHGLPPPRRSSGPQSEDFVAPARKAPRHPEPPRIATSHSICSTWVGAPWIADLAALPPIVVLVRDPVQAMASFQRKWGDRYGLTSEDYVGLPATLGRPLADAWWYIQFFNAWGRIARRQPGRVLVVRYEDLQGDPRFWLKRVSEHLGLHLGARALDAALLVAGREAVAAAEDPGFGEVIVSTEAATRGDPVTAVGRRRLASLLSRHLRHDFGYGYIAKPAVRARWRAPPSLILTLGYMLFSLFGRPVLGLSLAEPWNGLELAGEFGVLTALGAFAPTGLGLGWAKYVAAAAALVELAQVSPAVPGQGSFADLGFEWLGVAAIPAGVAMAVKTGLSLSRAPLRAGAQPTDRAWR